jgi:hypothetical protein
MTIHRLALAGAVGLVSLGLVERQAAALTVTSGLTYQLDSSSGVLLNGSAVTGWLDQSGNGRSFFQADPNKQPTFVASSASFNNKPIIRFDGNESGSVGNPLVAPNADELILNSATNNQTIFIVNRVTGNTGGLDGIWGQNDGDNGIRRQDSNSWANPGNGNDFTNTGTMRINGITGNIAPLNQTHILTGTRSGVLNLSATSIGDYFQVGANAARSYQGEIAEVIVYDRLLSASEIRSVESELAAKYGLRVAQVNVALGGKATTQTSTLGGFVSGNAVDGNLGNFTHTLNSDTNPTFTVDLGATVPINQVILNNRGDGCCQGRLSNINVEIVDRLGNVVQTFTGLNAQSSVQPTGPALLTIDLPKSVLGRTVRVSRTVDLSAPATDDNRVLALGEVQVMATNLALNGTVTQSTSHGSGLFNAGNAIDNNLGNFTHTDGNDTTASLTLDLGNTFAIDSVFLFNRGDGCCQGRLRDITVDILGENGNILASTLLNPGNSLNGPRFLAVDTAALFGQSISGRFIRVSRASLPGGGDDNNVLSLGELQVYGSAVVPEPATALLGAMGMGLLALRRRARLA